MNPRNINLNSVLGRIKSDLNASRGPKTVDPLYRSVERRTVERLDFDIIGTNEKASRPAPHPFRGDIDLSAMIIDPVVLDRDWHDN